MSRTSSLIASWIKILLSTNYFLVRSTFSVPETSLYGEYQTFQVGVIAKINPAEDSLPIYNTTYSKSPRTDLAIHGFYLTCFVDNQLKTKINTWSYVFINKSLPNCLKHLNWDLVTGVVYNTTSGDAGRSSGKSVIDVSFRVTYNTVESKLMSVWSKQTQPVISRKIGCLIIFIYTCTCKMRCGS